MNTPDTPPTLPVIAVRVWGRRHCASPACRPDRRRRCASRRIGVRRGRPGPPWLVGVAYACQELPALAAEDWDVPLDAVATELDWLAFGR